MFMGSSGSTVRGWAFLSTEQNLHVRVQTSPNIRKVAVGLEKHSPIFGHLADSQTVWRFLLRSIDFISWSLLAGPRVFFAQEGSLFIE
jgi:hypothetical protein